MQSPSQSMLETVVNTVLGFLVALILQITVFPILGIDIVLWENIGLATLFTTVNFIRAYLVRRWFERHNQQ